MAQCLISNAALIDAMATAGLVNERKVDAARLGKRLQLVKDKRINGQWISASKAHNNVSKWIVCGEGNPA
jgi:hypothetical protein